MEQVIIDTLLTKESVFALLFIYMLIRQMKENKDREDKLYSFLDDMKIEFAKLVGSYERLANDVEEIREEINQTKGEDKK